MKKLSLAVIGCVVLAGCAQPQQSTPPAASKSALPPIVQTVTQEDPILKANETVTPYVLFNKAIRIGSVDDKFPDYYALALTARLRTSIQTTEKSMNRLSAGRCPKAATVGMLKTTTPRICVTKTVFGPLKSA